MGSPESTSRSLARRAKCPEQFRHFRLHRGASGDQDIVLASPFPGTDAGSWAPYHGQGFPSPHQSLHYFRPVPKFYFGNAKLDVVKNAESSRGFPCPRASAILFDFQRREVEAALAGSENVNSTPRRRPAHRSGSLSQTFARLPDQSVEPRVSPEASGQVAHLRLDCDAFGVRLRHDLLDQLQIKRPFAILFVLRHDYVEAVIDCLRDLLETVLFIQQKRYRNRCLARAARSDA